MRIEQTKKAAYLKTVKMAKERGFADFETIVPYERFSLVVQWHYFKYGYKSRYSDIAEILIKNPYTGYYDIYPELK